MSNTARILLVDDEEAIRAIYSKILMLEGHEVWGASTGREALELAHEAKPEIVLLDLMLPDIGGIEVCREIKGHPDLAEISVVLFSGHATSGADKLQGADCGADDYLVKPVSREELLARIRTLIRLRNARTALLASEQHYRQLIEILPDGVWSIDLEGRIRSANPQAVQMFGFGSAEELLQKTIFDLVPTEEHGRLRDNIDATLQSGRPFKAEHQGVRTGGLPLEVELNVTLSCDREGKAAGLVAVVRDITESKRSKDQIRLLADAVHSARDLISITDCANRFTFVNQAFLQAYGYSEEEVLGRTPEFLYSAKNPAGLCAVVYHQTLRDGWNGELLNCRKDGFEVPIFLNTSLIKNSVGKNLGLIGVARNISEEKRIALQAAAFSQLSARLSGAVSPNEAAIIILEIASELYAWDTGYVHLLSPQENKTTHVLMFDTVDGKRQLVEPPSLLLTPAPLMQLLLKDGAQLVRQVDKVPSKLAPGDPQRTAACSMYVPIRSHGMTIGVISIQSCQPEIYSRQDLEVLQTLADRCADALKRIQLAEDLSEAEAKYRGIFENASEGIFRSTPGGRILSANPALAQITGYSSPEELVARVISLPQHGYVSPEVVAEFKRLIESRGFVEAYEAELYRKDGRRIWVNLNARTIRDAGGNVYYQGTMQDITERKRAQQRLADAMELNLTILSSSSVGIVSYRASGQCIFANAAAGKIVGASPEQLLQQNFRRIVSWRKCGLLQLSLKTLRDRTVQTGEIHLVSTYNKAAWLECHMACFMSTGEPHLLLLMSDITQRKQVEEELRHLPRRIMEAQEFERQRVARELHDSVNQLLASAQMRLQRVEEKVASVAPSAGEILLRCRDLLVQALEENRRIAHDLRPSDLDQLGFEVACQNFCKQFALRTNLKVRCQVGDLGNRLSPAVGLNLFRIVQEAFNNAHKHARATKVQLSISSLTKGLRLKIQDDGRGLPSSTAPKPARKHGIGLTNIRERAASLGGTCEIKSLPKRGTTITVVIPHTAVTG
jgi:PAS domain S-box-containing protein